MTCTNEAGQTYYNQTGYAGRGEGLNTPNAQDQPSVGPLPQGTYTVGVPYNAPKTTGQNTIPLTPDAATSQSITNMGRDPNRFKMHGDNQAQNHTASEGCIVLPPNRTQIPQGETVIVGP